MKLKKLEVSAFGGISPNAPVVIDFTQSKFVTAEGDNGVGKSSLLNALLVACGQLSKDANDKAFVNLETGKIDVNLEFVGKDRLTYTVRCTKSKFELTYEGEAVAEPITRMKDLLGVVGVSPMEIKFKPLKDIVKWLSAYSTKSAEEFEAQFTKYKEGIKKARETRAAANKELKALTVTLEDEPLFLDWEGSEKKYAKAVDLSTLSNKLKAAGKKSDDFITAQAGLKNFQSRKLQIEEQINLLTKEAEQIEQRIKAGEDFIEKNKSAAKEYDAVVKEYNNASVQAIDFNKWQEIKLKKVQKDEYETISQKADSREKEFLQSVKELQAEILPDIKGVELITEDTHVEGGKIKKEGLYFNGVNTAQMSETEWSALVMQIWRKNKVRIVVIDNMQSLGSMGVQWLQKLADDGAYILAAEMSREQKTLQITYE